MHSYRLEYEILIDDVKCCPLGISTNTLYQYSLSFWEGEDLHNNYSFSFKWTMPQLNAYILSYSI